MKQPELVGIAELAELFGVSRQAASNWRGRHDNFPSPVASLKSGPVWDMADISVWADEMGMEVKTPNTKTSNSNQNAGAECITASLVNMKGGVGKSTLTANLGWYAAYHLNKRVLLVDLDPQFNLSQYVLGNKKYEKHLNENNPTVVNIFWQHDPGQDQIIEPSSAITNVEKWRDGSYIDLVPSRLELAWILKNPHDKEHLLRDFLSDIKANYDLILIDCPPTESMLTTAAYFASDYLIVPVRPEFLSAIGLPLLVRSLDDFKNNHKNERFPELAGIIFNDSSATKGEHGKSRKYVKKVAKREGWHIFKGEISHSDSYPAGSRVGKPIFLTNYARSYKKEELEKAAKEIFLHININETPSND